MLEEKIKIVGSDTHSAFHFYVDTAKYRKLVGSRFCENCKSMILSPVYVYIIKMLKSAKLLQRSYPLLCCSCYKTMSIYLKGVENGRK